MKIDENPENVNLLHPDKIFNQSSKDVDNQQL